MVKNEIMAIWQIKYATKDDTHNYCITKQTISSRLTTRGFQVNNRKTGASHHTGYDKDYENKPRIMKKLLTKSNLLHRRLNNAS